MGVGELTRTLPCTRNCRQLQNAENVRIVFSGKSTPTGYPITNGQPRNIRRSKILHKLSRLYLGIYVCNCKSSHEFESIWEGLKGRKGREKLCKCIVI